MARNSGRSCRRTRQRSRWAARARWLDTAGCRLRIVPKCKCPGSKSRRRSKRIARSPRPIRKLNPVVAFPHAKEANARIEGMERLVRVVGHEGLKGNPIDEIGGLLHVVD